MKPYRLDLVLLLAVAACSSPAPGTGSLVPTPTIELPALPSAGHPLASVSYLYVENGNSTISVFGIAKSGMLAEIEGSPFASDTNSPADYSIAVDPKGPYLYASGSVSDNIAIFSIGSSGAPTLVSDSTQAGTGAGFLLPTKAGNRMYAIDEVNGGSVAAFDIHAGGKKLKALAGSPYQVTCPGFCTSNPSAAVISGSYLYTVDTYGWYVSAFSIAKSGALTELGSYATGYGPTEAVMTPSGAYLYVTDGAQAAVTGYSVAGGVLTQLPNSPFTAGGTPLGIAMTPNGKYVYVADNGDGTIFGYAVGSGGALEPLKGSPFNDNGSDSGPVAVAVDHSGDHLFVANTNTEQIAVYTIAGSGAIAQIKGSPFTEAQGASGPRGLAIY